MLSRARTHLQFVCKFCKIKIDAGRMFVHEHPSNASSWAEDCIIRLQKDAGAWILNVGQCACGLAGTTDDGRVLPALKPTSFLTNSPAMTTVLNRNCSR